MKWVWLRQFKKIEKKNTQMADASKKIKRKS